MVLVPNVDSTISKDQDQIRRSTVETLIGFPSEMLDMIKNSELSSLTLTGTKYSPPWDLLFQGFRKCTVTVDGDAMHVMGPFLGQGGSAALEDAVVLARCLGRQYCLEMKREWIEAAYIGSIREGEEAKAAAFVY